MLDSKALASIPLVPANTAAPAPDYPWPTPFRSAMFLSFDVDAESAWTSKDASHAQRLITMSYGGYEARVGTPKLLELLDQLDLKATFFITGWSVDAHPAMAESILKDQKRVIPTCCFLQGEFGVKGYYVGVPAVIGEKGIEKIIEFNLDAEEQAMMDKSVAAVKGLVDSMK